MPRPRFSIVIPTRQRAHTLYFTLRSCLMQSFDDYEIVVCDNCSSPATREVVESFASPSVR
jgi:glycosyltransferase involved in cell wall biosynthesis